MMDLSFLIFGYYEYNVEKEQVADALEILLRAGISARQSNNGFYASARDSKSVFLLLDTRVKFSRSEMRGALGFLVKNTRRIGVILAVVFIAMLFIISDDYIWSVRVEGNKLVSEDEVVFELKECGLAVGEKWSETDIQKIESALLIRSEKISWLNINRRGSVAYVEVIEKKEYSEKETTGYSNIVAAKDAIIEEISVVSGVAKVAVGDSVMAGDVLILGVYPESIGGGFCHAEGIVKGRVNDSLSVNISRNTEIKEVSGEKILKINIKIFNFLINIFNKYRNLPDGCDIIVKREVLSFLGKDLPIEIEREYIRSYEAFSLSLSDDEMVKKASYEISELLCNRTLEATLLKLTSKAYFKDDFFIMQTDIVCIEDIIKDAPFEFSANGENDRKNSNDKIK